MAERFGAFEALANSSIKLARHVSEDELAMDPQIAGASLQFRDDLRHGAEPVAPTSR